MKPRGTATLAAVALGSLMCIMLGIPGVAAMPMLTLIALLVYAVARD